MKARILIIDNSTSHTGALKSILHVSRMHADHYEITLCADQRVKPFINAANIAFYAVRFVELRKGIDSLIYFPALLINSWRILKFVHAQGIGLIHVNDIYNMTGVVIKILDPGIRLVYHVRLMPDSYVRSLYALWIRIINRFSDAIVACSQAVRRGLNTHPSKTFVVCDAVDVREKHPQKRITPGAKPIRLLYLANFIPGKGHDHAIKAFAIAFSRDQNLRLRMVGGTLNLEKNERYKKRLENAARDADLEKVIDFGDFEFDVERLMKSSEVFLNFSDSESFSLTCLEALVYGVPLIATDSGGPSELFEDGVSGCLVPTGDVGAMAAAILRLSRDPGLRQRFAAAGKAAVARKFAPEISSRELTAIYDRLLSPLKVTKGPF